MREVPADCARKFTPERLIAEGGFGAVYLARQHDLARSVALKVLHPDLLTEQVQVTRFLNEARITSRLVHPHIVVLIDHGLEDGVPWIAYEYVPGESLRARLKSGPLPWLEACRIADQVAAALGAAHKAGVLHRDIKPDNILQSGNGHYKVADFGIAKLTNPGSTLTAQGVILGTPAYLSPVQLRGEVPGPESDLYALGITLFEMIAGHVPFEGESPIDTLQMHLTRAVPRLSDVAPDVPRELDVVMARLLAKSRAERFHDADALRAQLHPLLERSEGSPDRATPAVAVSHVAPGTQTRAVSRPARAAPGPEHAPRPMLPARSALPPRTRLYLGAAGTAALLALAALAVRAPAPTPPAPTASAVVSVAPAPPFALFDLQVMPTFDRVRVSFTRPPDCAVEVALGEDDPVVWKRTVRIDPGEAFCARELTNLEPGHAYRLRIVAPDRSGGLKPFRFQTAADTDRRLLRNVADALRTHDPASFDSLRSFLLEVPRDPDLIVPLTRFLDGPDLSQDILGTIAWFARELPSVPLLTALLRRCRGGDPSVEGEAVGQACAAGIPEAVKRARELLRPPVSRGAVIPLIYGLARGSHPELFDDLIRFVKSPAFQGHVPLPQTLYHADPERAAAFFATLVLDVKPDEQTYLLGVAGAAMLPPGQLERLLATLAPRGRAHVARVAEAIYRANPTLTDCAVVEPLLEQNPDLPHLVNLAYLGCERARADLMRFTLNPSPEARRVSWTALSLLPADESVAGWLEVPERRALAAWALSRGGPPGAIAALRRLAGGPADPQGLMVWALARLKHPDAAALVRANLATPGTSHAEQLRLALAAWAAGELDLKDTRGSLSALAGKSGFVGQCASEAVQCLDDQALGRPLPRTFLVPPELRQLRTGIRVDSYGSVEAFVIPLGKLDDRHGNFADITSSVAPHVLELIVHPAVELLKLRKRSVFFADPGELVVARKIDADGAIWCATPQPFLRVSVRP